MIKLGSLFAGIGGFELGAQWAFDRAGIPHKILFQVEQNKYCQSVLRKHWPGTQIFDDVRAVGRHNLPDVDVLIGGFPCQDISVAGHQKGIINGKKSSLWFEMLRIIGELRPAIVVLENVPAIVRVGGPVVVGGLTEIGYDCEWQIVSARQFGAPHLRKRWFCVATDTESGQRRRVRCRQICEEGQKSSGQKSRHEPRHSGPQAVATDANRIGLQTTRAKQQTTGTLKCGELDPSTADANRDRCRQTVDGRTSSVTSQRRPVQQRRLSKPTNADRAHRQRDRGRKRIPQKNEKSRNDICGQRLSSEVWEKGAPVAPLCSVDDGIPDRLARLRALGNAIVPQCSEYIFEYIIKNIIQND